MKNATKDKSKAKGGIARAKVLTPEKRKEIAEKAAITRWGAKATHKGNFKKELGFDADCYVLNDRDKTAVISQSGMGQALGFSKGGSRFPRFVNGKVISEYIGSKLRNKLDNPIIFQTPKSGHEESNSLQAYGYDVTILIDICKIVIDIESDGKLLESQKNIARQAHAIVNASAKAGIQGLVYALSGYDRTKEEVIAAFKLYIQEEARDYEHEFPEMLYNEWYRIYDLPKPERNRPWKFMHLTNDHVYFPLANSKGKLRELIIAKRDETKEAKQTRLHQFLSVVGVKALRQHLGQLLGIAQLSDNKEEYERNFKKVFGSNLEIPFHTD